MNYQIRNNISYRNSDSPESTLKVKYKYKEGTKIIEFNKNLTPLNNILPKINPNRSINKANELRQQHFNSYTNENMDFFRLDYLKECDRNHYHNKYYNNLTPINRNEHLDKLNEHREKIKYLDSIKKNFLLKKENDKKEFFKDNLYTSENIIRNNYYKKINNIYTNNQKSNDRYKENNNEVKLFNNISIGNPKYSGAYLSNVNDYSIKENQEINPLSERNINNNISKRAILSKQSHLFCKDVINNDMPALFYKLYDYNFKNNGFKKQNDIFSSYMQNSKKSGYIERDIESTPNNSKGNITPPKRININDNYYYFSQKEKEKRNNLIF